MLGNDHLLPKLSVKAFFPGGTELRACAVEGRSVVYGMMIGLGKTLAQLQTEFPGQGAVFGNGICDGSRIFYKWARGEATPRRARVRYQARFRPLLDILGDELPGVRVRVGHPVWLSMDSGIRADETSAAEAFARLSAEARAIFWNASRNRFFCKPDRMALLRAIESRTSEVQKAELMAALLFWHRSMQSEFLFGPDFLDRPLRELIDQTIDQFIQSDWVYPGDAAIVASLVRQVKSNPFLSGSERKSFLGAYRSIKRRERKRLEAAVGSGAASSAVISSRRQTCLI